MNLIIAISIAAGISATTLVPQDAAPLSLNKLYSDAGYPYNMLLERADSMKIIYTIKAQEVTCSVLLENGDAPQESPKVIVSKKHFNEEPLANCLLRVKAKQWLAATF